MMTGTFCVDELWKISKTNVNYGLLNISNTKVVRSVICLQVNLSLVWSAMGTMRIRSYK